MKNPPWSKPIDRVSVSGLNTFDSCKRLWALTYGHYERSPSTPSQALGTEVHRVAEEWLSKRVAPNPSTQAGRIFLPGIRLWPDPREVPIQTEVKLTYPLDDVRKGLSFVGYVDVLFTLDNILYIGDHKTCKSFNYAHSQESLVTDRQACCYAYVASRTTPEGLGSHGSMARWVYYRTDCKASTIAVQAQMSQNVDRVWDGAKSAAASAIELAAKCPKPEDVEPNLDHCRAYGGCHFRSRCAIWDGSRQHEQSDEVKSFFSEEIQVNQPPGGSLLDQIMGGVNQAPVPIQVQSPQQSPAPVPQVLGQACGICGVQSAHGNPMPMLSVDTPMFRGFAHQSCWARVKAMMSGQAPQPEPEQAPVAVAVSPVAEAVVEAAQPAPEMPEPEVVEPAPETPEETAKRGRQKKVAKKEQTGNASSGVERKMLIAAAAMQISMLGKSQADWLYAVAALAEELDSL